MGEHHVPPPVALSLVACERVIVDALTGQYNLIGVVSNVQGQQFPYQLGQLCLYAELTNGHGPTKLRLRIIDAGEEEEPVLEAELEISMDHPLSVKQVVFGANGLIFPEKGEYRVQFFAGDHLMTERRITLLQASSAEHGT
jgi:hypothetical protein